MNTPFTRRATDVKPRRQRKGMYILPSAFTIANLGAGFYAILQATQGNAIEPSHFNYAAIAIGLAVVFDGLDGTIARLTNTSSDFGRELDSLADVVTFGVAPAALAYFWGFHQLPFSLDPDVRHNLLQFGAVACFLFLAAGASRLARFNITLNPQPKNPGRPGRKYFVGMPIPAGAGCIAATVHLSRGTPITTWWIAPIWIVGVLVLGFLMVSTWRFWSAKSIDLRSRHPFRLILIVALFIALIRAWSRYVLFAIAVVYLLSGIFSRISFAIRHGGDAGAPGAPAESSQV